MKLSSRHSIKTRMVLLLLSLIILVVVAIARTSAQREQAKLFDDHRMLGGIIAAHFQQTVSMAGFTHPILQPAAVVTATQHNISKIAVVDNKFKVVASSDFQLVGEKSQDAEHMGYFDRQILVKSLDQQETLKALDSLKLFSPLFSSTGRIGSLIIEIDISGDRQKIMTEQAKTLFLSLALFSIVMVIIYHFFAKKIVRPVEQLKRATLEIAKGQFNHRVSITSGDEFAELGQAFNKMGSDLALAQAAIAKRLEAEADAAAKGASEKYVQSIFQSLTEILFVVNHDGIIKTVNKKALEILNYSEDALLNRPYGDIIAEEEEEEEEEESRHFGRRLQTLVQENAIRDHIGSYFTKSGEKIPVSITGSVIRNDAGRITEIVLSAKDLRDSRMLKELKSTQEQLVQSAKLASLGEMSSGLAHELNNPLFMVLGNTNQIIRHLKETNGPKEIEEPVTWIKENTKRMERIIKHFREFARQSDHKFSDFNIDNVVEKSFTLLDEQLRLKNIKVERELSADVTVRGDPNRIEQVLVNLFTNARDAIEKANGRDGGTLRVQTAIKGQFVEIRVEDDGSGVPDDIEEKIFDPFFTTKEVGKGTGLGLSISYGIIKEHKGSIGVRKKERGRGSVFTVTLPLPIKEQQKKVA